MKKTYVIKRTGRRNPAPRIKLASGEELKLYPTGSIVRELTDEDVATLLRIPGTIVTVSTARVVREPPPEKPKPKAKAKTKRKKKAAEE
jgi:hypothetical protein